MILEPIINLPNSSRIAASGAANNGSGSRIAARGAAGNGAAAGKGTAGSGADADEAARCSSAARLGQYRIGPGLPLPQTRRATAVLAAS